MKQARKQRYLLAAVIAILANQVTWECPRAKAQEPVEWCGTHDRRGATAGAWSCQGPGASCPTCGPCDRPSVRNSRIPEPCTPIVRIRLKLNILCETDGSNCAATPSDVPAQMAELNSAFAPHRIQFVWDSEYIHDSDYREVTYDPEGGGTDDAMKERHADNPTAQLNVYVVTIGGGTLTRGVGVFPWDPDALTKQGGVLIDDGGIGPEQNILMHEIGHTLGLYHTFQEGSGGGNSPCPEPAEGVDPDTTGDFASDTPPDFPENFMSYSADWIRKLFTPQQAGRMHCWLHAPLPGLWPPKSLTGWIACTSNGECDDRSECTQDACVDGGCQNTAIPDATVCAGGVCCGGRCACSSDADCDDGVACTTDVCVNAGTCDLHYSYCAHPGGDCDLTTPNGCCGPTCTRCNDADCLSTNEAPNSTCRDGLDNDCDLYTDCEDVADCAGDPACNCYDIDGIGGPSPLVCVDRAAGS